MNNNQACYNKNHSTGDSCCPSCSVFRADDIPHRIDEHKKKKERMNTLIKKAYNTPVNQLKMKKRVNFR